MASKQDQHTDDASLLEQVFKDVTPLPGRKIRRNATESPKPKNLIQPLNKEARHYSKRRKPEAPLPEIGHGKAPGLDHRSAKRLKRGQMKIEDSLDLHGCNQQEAHSLLTSFIASAQNAGKRCVLIITGKGQITKGSGVLRTNVPGWLNQSPNRAKVLSFTYALPKDGGTGALYVLLRRQRQ